jgi:hypothetical protein
VLRRPDTARVVSFARGEIRIDDRHSRLRVPLRPPRAPRLAELFGVDAALLAEALARSGEGEATSTGGGLTAYLETTASPAAAFDSLARPGVYRRFLEGVAAVTLLEELPDGWRLTLAPPAGESGSANSLTEEVTLHPDRLALRVRRVSGGGHFDSELRAENRDGRTYLIREAFFDAPREDLLRNDSLRGRLAGTLAVDLLAWTRLLPDGAGPTA